MMVDPRQLRRWMAIPYADGGRSADGVDCYGLHRMIVGELTGVWLAEWSGTTDALEIARTLAGERAEGGWRKVDEGDERVADLVLMTGVAGAGMAARVVPMHVGTVLQPPMMMDIEIGRSAMVGPIGRHPAYRSTRGWDGACSASTGRPHWRAGDHDEPGMIIGRAYPEPITGRPLDFAVPAGETVAALVAAVPLRPNTKACATTSSCGSTAR